MSQAEAGERLAHSLLAAKFGTEFLTNFSDSRLGTTITLGYETPATDAPIEATEVAAFVSQSLAEFTASGEAPVVVAFGENGLREEREFVAMQGGRKLNTTVDGITYICTSGFGTKRDSNGNRGLVTASHCVDTGGGMQYESSIGALGGPVHVGPSDVDVQFNKAEGLNTVTNEFKATSTAIYQVTSVANPVEGDEVSKYGRTTGWSAGVVVDANTCNNQATWCKLVKVNGMNADGGDSGGPCFRGYGARGLVQGGIPGSYTYCTRIGTLSADGFTVLTQ